MLINIGSSPRAWGTQYLSTLFYDVGRFIPTCMGNSVSVIWSSSTVAVHPHVHGELSECSKRRRQKSGSSPRAWGTLYLKGLIDGKTRFIPTCMGNSNNPYNAADIPAVHPHVHGELKPDNLLVQERVGSSPRAWGTHGNLSVR
mgnify:CR=1 FL=1